MSYGGWELPPESTDHLCLVITASDERSSWTAGLIRVREGALRGRPNRDAKRQLSAASRERIRALWPAHGRRAENLFLHCDPRVRHAIFSARSRRGLPNGQARANGLFPPVHRRIIRRPQLAPEAPQDDFTKRALANAGAPSHR